MRQGRSDTSGQQVGQAPLRTRGCAVGQHEPGWVGRGAAARPTPAGRWWPVWLAIAVGVLVVALGGLLALAGVFSIANVMLTRVLERRAEIGLRRALGASRNEVLSLIVAEGTLLGTLGAVLGATAGALVALAVAQVQGWPAPWMWAQAAGTVLGGGMAGALASVYPAYRAARIEPAETLRGG